LGTLSSETTRFCSYSLKLLV